MTTASNSPSVGNTPDIAAALKPLALLAAGRTGADIERMVRELRAAARRQKRPFVWADIEQALGQGRAKRPAELTGKMAIHEIGHAIAYSVLGLGEVETVSIAVPTGGMVTAKLNGHMLQDEVGIMRLAACILAGRCAEKMMFGTALVGAGGGDDSDLAKATRIAFDAELSLGLAEKQPLLYRAPSNISEALLYNDGLAARVNQRLEAAEMMAMDVLETHRPILITLAERLAQVQVMDGETVRHALAAGGGVVAQDD